MRNRDQIILDIGNEIEHVGVRARAESLKLITLVHLGSLRDILISIKEHLTQDEPVINGRTCGPAPIIIGNWGYNPSKWNYGPLLISGFGTHLLLSNWSWSPIFSLQI